MKVVTLFKTRFVLLLAAGFVLFQAGSLAYAQSYPVNQIRIVVPFPPGGSTDVLARELGNQLGSKLGVTVIIDNRPGASGIIGSELVAKSPPNGATFLFTATHHVINPSLYKKLPYDSRRDFTPIALVAVVPIALVVSPSVPAKTVPELIALAKKEPGKLFFGSGSIGGANHLAGELFRMMANVDIRHAPYKGDAPALSDLLGGHIPIMFSVLPTVLHHVQEGKLRALGVASLKRVPSLPDLPTIDEIGVKGLEATAWFGLYGPANISPKVRSTIEQAVADAMASPKLRETFAKLGAEPGTLVGKSFETYVDAEMAKWNKVVESAHVKLD